MIGLFRHLRWFVPLSTLLISSTLAYAWAEDASGDRKREARQHQELRREIQAKHDHAVNLDGYREQLKELQVLYADLARRLPSELLDPALWAALAAESSGVSVIKVERQPDETSDFYERSEASVRLEGGFTQFLDFVDTLAHVSTSCPPERPRCGGPLHSISRVAMRQHAPGILRIDLDVALYRYLVEEGS